jgi:YegS/Rv2252/BmrU family lipid kinase
MSSSQTAFYILFNPMSGGKKTPAERDAILRELTKAGMDSVFEDRDDTHAYGKTLRAIEQGYRKFIVMGGDGTLNQTVNAIFKSGHTTEEFVLGMIPFGSGNDWIKTSGIPRNPLEAARALGKATERKYDIGKVEYQKNGERETAYFINISGFAYDAFVNRNTLEATSKKWLGGLSYQLTMLRCLIRFSHVMAKITVDGKEIETRLFSGSVGKGRYNGNGMMQLPHADPADGMLAFTLIKDISKLGIVAQTKNLHDGSFVKNKHVEIGKGKHIRVETDPPVELECEGEQFGTTPFEFTVMPAELKILVP